MQKIYKFVRPGIFKVDPETAHGLTIKAFKAGLIRSCQSVSSPALEQKLFNLNFKNPVGIAAGFDKNAEVIPPMLKLGFGFVEAGTVTPKPQNGNPRPRIFRDPESESIINRMGFPNGGARVFKPNLEQARRDLDAQQNNIIGVNIGMNKGQSDPAADYCHLIEALAPQADYLTINISSPNTPGLRDLQEKSALSALLKQVTQTLKTTCPKAPPALLVKLAPDLSDAQQEEIAETLIKNNVDGVILANTTLDRPDTLPETFRSHQGGLSGAPLHEKSTAIIRNFHKITKGKLPIIGVGGISNADQAYEKIRAGASLVQLYTGMIYQGPDIANTINTGLINLLETDGFSSIQEAIGIDS